MAGVGGGKPAELLARARTLSSDAAAVEVTEALRAVGVPVILLKGPAIASWLYEDDERVYTDADLLVPSIRSDDAEAALARLGFAPYDEGLNAAEQAMVHSQPWVRGRDLAQIDLHRTLFGVGVGPEKTWAELHAATERMVVAGVELDVLAPAGRALHVAVHAVQHENRQGKPLEDLERAIDRLPPELWADALELAERLDATPTFALGLAQSPGGASLARRLGMSPELARAATAEGSAASLAMGFERLARSRGLGAKVRLVTRELLPSRDFIWWSSPLARRGPIGMALAYLWRPFWLAARVVPSLAAWRKHRARA
jgi:hypothetical protein